jgi:hypothetical protein
VQAAGNLIGALAEFSAGVEIRQDEFERGNLVNRMEVDRDAATVVLHRARTVEVDADRDLRCKSGKRFVDGVVNDLEHAVVQTALVRVADIHVGAFSHALEALEFLDLGSVVSRSAGLEFFVVVRVGSVGHEKAVYRGKMEGKISRGTAKVARVILRKIRG